MPENLNPDEKNLPAAGVEAAARALYFADAHHSISPDAWPDFDSPENAAKDRYYEVAHEVVYAFLAATTTIEYAGKHKHAGIEYTTRQDQP